MATPLSFHIRSAAEYNFRADQTEAIIRAVTYHRHDFFQSVISFSDREHDDILSSIVTPFQRASNVGLGSLDRLPLELLLDTLKFLDMHSLFKFRQINLRSRQVVDSLGQYQRAVSHGMNLFCALLRTRLAIDTSLLDFDNSLCTKECAFCGKFAGFISILAWKRCCYKCLQKSPETQVRSLGTVRRLLHLTSPKVGQLRSIKSLPGIYGPGNSVQKSRIEIVSLHQATLAHKPQSCALSQVQPVRLDKYRKFGFMGSCALPYYDRKTCTIECGISCAGCARAVGEKLLMGIPSEQLSDEAQDLYARDGFLDHFRWCEQAQLLWKSSCKV